MLQMPLQRPAGIAVPQPCQDEFLGKDLFPKLEIEIPQVRGLRSQRQACRKNCAGAGSRDQIEAVAEEFVRPRDLVKLLFDLDERFGGNQPTQSAAVNGK